MKIEYKITFDSDTRKGLMEVTQDDGIMVDSHPIKYLSINESRNVGYVKDAEGKIIDIIKNGPTMISLTMTGADDE